MKPEHVDLLRHALPFIKKFKGKNFVVKIGGDIADTPQTLHSFCEEIALCAQVGIPCVVIHGGGKQATEFSEKLGIEPRMIQGRRITDDQVLDVVKMVFAGKINVEIISSLRKAGVPAVGLSGVDGNIVYASRRPPKMMKDDATGKKVKVDFGHVGDIERVDTRLLTKLLEADYVPVVASLGADDEGNIYNINADTIAAFIAAELPAEKLILASDVDGIFVEENGQKKVISDITVTQVKDYIEKGIIKGGMVPKVQGALEALKKGVHNVHIINGMSPNSLLTEVFTEEGCGTMITK